MIIFVYVEYMNMREQLLLLSRLSFNSRLNPRESTGLDGVVSGESFYQKVYTSFKGSILCFLNYVFKHEQNAPDSLDDIKLQEVIIDLVWIVMISNRDDISIVSFNPDQWFKKSMIVLENMLNKDFLAKVTQLVKNVFMIISDFKIIDHDSLRNKNTPEDAEINSEDQRQDGIEEKLWLEPLLKDLKTRCLIMYLMKSENEQGMQTKGQDFSPDLQKEINRNSLKVLLKYLDFVDQNYQKSSERGND